VGSVLQEDLQTNVYHDGRNGQSQARATQAASCRLPPVQAPQAVVGEEGRAQTGTTRRDAARDACCARRAVFVGFPQPLIVGHLSPRYVRVSLGARTHTGFAQRTVLSTDNNTRGGPRRSTVPRPSFALHHRHSMITPPRVPLGGACTTRVTPSPEFAILLRWPPRRSPASADAFPWCFRRGFASERVTPVDGASRDELERWLATLEEGADAVAFPSDAARDAYLDSLPTRSEVEVRAFLRRILMPTGEQGIDQFHRKWLKHLIMEEPETFVEVINREYFSRLIRPEPCEPPWQGLRDIGSPPGLADAGDRGA